MVLGGIDCDIHPTVNSTTDLYPYLEGYWAEMVPMRTLGMLGKPLFTVHADRLSGPLGEFRPVKTQ